MTTLVEEAVKVLRELPDDRQAAAARAIISFAIADDDLQLTDEEVEEIERRMENPKREFLSVNEVMQRLRRYGV